MKVSEWAFDRTKEAFAKVAKDEARKLSTVQEMMIRSTDYLRRIIAPAEEARWRYDVILVPHCDSFPMEDHVWLGLLVVKSTQIGGARFDGEKYDWKQPKQALGGANRRKY